MSPKITIPILSNRNLKVTFQQDTQFCLDQGQKAKGRGKRPVEGQWKFKKACQLEIPLGTQIKFVDKQMRGRFVIGSIDTKTIKLSGVIQVPRKTEFLQIKQMDSNGIYKLSKNTKCILCKKTIVIIPASAKKPVIVNNGKSEFALMRDTAVYI